MGSKCSYFMFLLWLSYLIVSGILLFTRGFLLTRVAQKEVNICQPFTDIPCGPRESNFVSMEGEEFSCSQHDRLASLLQDVNTSTRTCLPKRARVVLIVIDALKYEFTEYDENLKDPQPYQNKMPIIPELLKAYPQKSRLYKFMADPPTTTLQRLKGLTTGSLPTFIDAGSNFATPEINEDNIIDQVLSHGGKAVLLGDDTWAGLYPKRWIRSVAMPSFNTWDLDTVDNVILNHLPDELARNDWDVLVAHFLGVDHCGHRYGPRHEEMARKLTQMNSMIQDVVNTIDNNTVLLVIGDHGMTMTGDHGGETEAEVKSAMFMLSPHKLMTLPDLLSPKIIRQVDLVPTLSAILGVTPPYSNLGAIILDALPYPEHLQLPFNNWQFALMNMWANVKQVAMYMQHYSQSSDQFSEDKIESIEKKFLILSHRVQSIYNERAFYSFATDAREFLVDVRSMCQEVWIQFDSFSMSRGLLITFLTIFFSYMIIDGIPGLCLPEIFRSSFLWFSYSAMGLAVFASIGSYYLSIVDNLQSTILFSTGMISISLLALLVGQNWDMISQHWYESTKKRHWSSLAAKACLGFSCCAIFSNSYVVEEGLVLYYLLISLVLMQCYMGKCPKLFVPLFLGFAISLSLSRFYQTCREEQGKCYFDKINDITASTSYTVVVGLVTLAIFVSLTRLWLRSCGNLVSPDTILWKYAPSVTAVCMGCYWVASMGPQKPHSRADGLARIIFGIVAVSVIVLIIRPLSVHVLARHTDGVNVYSNENIVPQLFQHMRGMWARNVSNRRSGDEDSIPVVCGIGTVYSAVYIMFGVWMTILVTLLLGANTAPSIVLMCSAGAFMLVILAIVRIQNAQHLGEALGVDVCGIECWVLLGLYFFYGTGHQAALSSIQWGAAFVGASLELVNNVVAGALVIINTFGSLILTGVCLPLLCIAPLPLQVMWPPHSSRPPSQVDLSRGELLLYEREDIFMSSMFNVAAKYILFHAVRIFVCMLAATVHCRHLMVWKVFAPKLIFEALGMFVTLAGVLIAFLLLIRVHSVLGRFLNRITKNS